ncbi:hypothetical protein C2857_002185 [Epichloe festucae Fl1]|uniref:Peroxisomal membrane protein PEX14 n=1 Tax=Epichloe festucae (strain Fl1) TaxID=877507 RepID=A0A7S9KJZ9_EPIFF|nr:hypothetical protein C2857_002185 [Epichloe festucae Fl1]
MSDTDDKPGAAAAAEHEKPNQQDTQPDQLEVARRFLGEEHVKASSRDRKIEFLKAKGLNESDIERLLGQAEESNPPAASQQEQSLELETTTTKTPTSTSRFPPSNGTNDRPPIVTYPEFLVKPERPPPLVTRHGLINTLYAFAGLSTILYATSKYLIAPMVENLTEARTELHHVAAKKLDHLVAQLERTVSVIPSACAQSTGYDEKDSIDAEDPTEMFHRDVGTQTSLIDNAPAPAAKSVETASKSHADNLASLTKTLSVLKDQFRAQSEGFEDVKALLDVFRDDLDGMTYGGVTDLVGGYDVYGTSKKHEPEDEIRKVRDNIRRVKGVLLSTRNFPASTR